MGGGGWGVKSDLTLILNENIDLYQLVAFVHLCKTSYCVCYNVISWKDRICRVIKRDRRYEEKKTPGGTCWMCFVLGDFCPVTELRNDRFTGLYRSPPPEVSQDFLASLVRCPS